MVKKSKESISSKITALKTKKNKTTVKEIAKVASKISTKEITINPVLKRLLEAGAHFGHRVDRWNPKMAPYIYGNRGGIHVIDLTKTYEQLKAAEAFAESVTKAGGTILFVGTKRQARLIIKKYAESIDMPYVINRWLGGMLTNLDTIQKRVLKLKKLESQISESLNGTKKEKAAIDHEIEHLNKVFGGIKQMETLPSAVFIVDTIREKIAINEARKLNIPIIAICDSNSNPEIIDYPIAANDDAVKTIELITEKIAIAAKNGLETYKAKIQVAEAQKDVTRREKKVEGDSIQSSSGVTDLRLAKSEEKL